MPTINLAWLVHVRKAYASVYTDPRAIRLAHEAAYSVVTKPDVYGVHGAKLLLEAADRFNKQKHTAHDEVLLLEIEAHSQHEPS